MITLPEFKENVIRPLLRGDAPTIDQPVTLLAVEFDSPLDYVFESSRWDEISGATKRLTQAGEQSRAVLARDGITADDLLHSTSTGFLALCPDESVARRWAESIERAVAQETDIVTVSSAIQTCTLAQLNGGLYRAPRSVIGVPGMTDYQERINRYYGLDSPSTIPKEDAISQRRHFGEVIALMDVLLRKARESRQIVPFYESIPFALRCASCRKRPAEVLDKDDQQPCCGVCQRKRQQASSGQQLTQFGLVTIEAVGLDRVLSQQRTPAAYHRVCTELMETLRKAVEGKSVGKPSSITILSEGLGCLTFAAPIGNAMESASSGLESIAQHYGLKLPLAMAASVVLVPSIAQCRDAYTLSQQTTAHLRRTIDNVSCMVDVRITGQPFDRFRKPYTLDEARQLISGVVLLRDAKFPTIAFAELPEQLAKGSAGLYYTFEKAKLSNQHQQLLHRLERDWDVGTVPGPRFYAMFMAALAVARM